MDTSERQWIRQYPAFDEVVRRLRELFRKDAPLVPEFTIPGFAEQLASFIGLGPENVHVLTRTGVLDKFMYEACREAQSERAGEVTQSMAAAHSNAAAAGGTVEDADVENVDQFLPALLQKYSGASSKWNNIVKELEQQTGIRKSVAWCKRRAKTYLLHKNITRCKQPGAGESSAMGEMDFATIQEAALEGMLDHLAGETAFKEAASVVDGAWPGSLPSRKEVEMQDMSAALLFMLWSDEDFASQSGFFQGVAINMIHAEDDGAGAPLLLQVYSHLVDHAESRPALHELQSLLCFLSGLHLSTNLMHCADLAAIERAVELFAHGFLLSDTAFFALKKEEQGSGTTHCFFGGVEAMTRCSNKLLQARPQLVPALLVQSRLQFGDDMAKLQLQKKCMAALESRSHGNEKWAKWKARLHELRGLTFGGLGDHHSAVKEYALSLNLSRDRKTLYLKAQSLQAIGQPEEANHLLDEFLTSVADDAAYDDHLFPNALYLKGTIDVSLQVHLQAPRDQVASVAMSYCKQAVAAESERCPFYKAVDSVAKRSLHRMCRVMFGSAKERQAALVEFRMRYQSGGNLQPKQTNQYVGLSDLKPDEMVPHTPEKSDTSDSSQIGLHILEFSRHPPALRDALLHGDGLAACRAALVEHGFHPELPSGAKVFAHPGDFEFVLDALQGRDLKPWHVIVSAEFLDAVKLVVSSLRSKEQVRQKSDSREVASRRICERCGFSNPRFICQRCRMAHYCSKECQKLDYQKHAKVCGIPSEVPISFTHTFLHAKLPSSSGRSVVTKSTTDADPRKGVNPRACKAAEEMMGGITMSGQPGMSDEDK